MTKYKVTMTVGDYVKVGDKFEHIKAEQKLEFDSYDDLQNWQGYTIDALGDNELVIKIRTEKEEE